MSYIIVDGNSIGYSAHSVPTLSVDDLQVQAIYHSLNILKGIKERFPEYRQVLWLWDGGRGWRHDVCPEYKANRTDSPEKVEMRANYKRALPYLERALLALGVPQFRAEGFEADDLAGVFVRQAEKKDRKSVLVTGDKDWLQLVSTNVRWHDPRGKEDRNVTRATFKENTGVDKPEQFLELKAMQGDASDNISGWVGVGEKTGRAIIAEYGSVKTMLQSVKAGEELRPSLSRAKKKILANLDSDGVLKFVRNYRLMSLLDSRNDEKALNTMKVTNGAFDRHAFTSLCEELRFMSILSQLERWERVFGDRRKAA